MKEVIKLVLGCFRSATIKVANGASGQIGI